jgi:hypothetical protein
MNTGILGKKVAEKRGTTSRQAGNKMEGLGHEIR